MSKSEKMKTIENRIIGILCIIFLCILIAGIYLGIERMNYGCKYAYSILNGDVAGQDLNNYLLEVVLVLSAPLLTLILCITLPILYKRKWWYIIVNMIAAVISNLIFVVIAKWIGNMGDSINWIDAITFGITLLCRLIGPFYLLIPFNMFIEFFMFVFNEPSSYSGGGSSGRRPRSDSPSKYCGICAGTYGCF